MKVRASRVTRDGEKWFLCRFCWQDFGTSDELDTHEGRHVSQAGFRCLRCSALLSTEEKLSRHYRSRHQFCENQSERKKRGAPAKIAKQSSEFTCRYCGDIFETIGGLQQHDLAHLGGKGFKCLLCEQSFEAEEKLTWHHKTRHRARNQTDSPLKKEAASQEIKTQIKSVGTSPVKEMNGLPSSAGPKSSDPFVIIRKLRIKSEPAEVEVKSEREECSSIVPLATPSMPPSNLAKVKVEVTNISSATYNGTLKCVHCPGRLFTTNNNLTLHILRVHTSEAEKPFRCPVPRCVKGFATRSEFSRHVNSCQRKHNSSSTSVVDGNFVFQEHAVAKPNRSETTTPRAFGGRHVCLNCGPLKDFPTSSALNAHYFRMHASYEERPYVCDRIPNCGKRYGTMSELNVHIKNKHNNVKPAAPAEQLISLSPPAAEILQLSKVPKIEIKAEKFEEAEVLKQAVNKILVTTKVGKLRSEFPCPFCYRSFTSQKRLRQHTSTIHKDLHHQFILIKHDKLRKRNTSSTAKAKAAQPMVVFGRKSLPVPVLSPLPSPEIKDAQLSQSFVEEEEDGEDVVDGETQFECNVTSPSSVSTKDSGIDSVGIREDDRVDAESNEEEEEDIQDSKPFHEDFVVSEDAISGRLSLWSPEHDAEDLFHPCWLPLPYNEITPVPSLLITQADRLFLQISEREALT